LLMPHTLPAVVIHPGIDSMIHNDCQSCHDPNTETVLNPKSLSPDLMDPNIFRHG
jgi:hypothetical protein